MTPDNAKIFHPTPDIKGKKCPTPDIQNLTRHPTPKCKNATPKCKQVKNIGSSTKEQLHQVDTQHCDFQVDIRHCKIFEIDTCH